MRRWSSPGNLLVVALALVAVALARQGVALAAQGPQLSAVFVESLPPLDPGDPAWERAPAFEVPLIPQVAASPTLPQISVPAVSVRAMNDGRAIAFRLEWADATRDAAATRPDSFRDAAAIQLPAGETLTAICMGAPGEITNIWHWKADWQEDLDQGFQELPQAYPNFWKDYYAFATGQPPHRLPGDFQSAAAQSYVAGWAAGNPLSIPERVSPVEEVRSRGFGTLSAKAGQNVAGKGVWSGGRWQVVFVRPFRVPDPEAATFAPGKAVPVAFAVWNGSNQEVGARKQLSTFVTIAVASPSELWVRWWPVALVAAVALALTGAGVALASRRAPRG